MHMTINNKYVQPLLIGLSPSIIVTPNVDYNSIVFRNTQRLTSANDIRVVVWAKLDSDTGDHLHTRFYLTDNKVILSGGSCAFKIYAVSLDNTYAETEIFSGSATIQSDGSFVLDIPYSSFTPTTELDGERTILISSSITRRSKTYRSKEYFNHIGIYDNVLRLRNKVKFLEITKKDFGT